jgi:RNA polymerase sigma factor (sigma-70 family)
MAPSPDPAAESVILREWTRGATSSDEAFEQLYREYGPVVHVWLRVRAGDTTADDLFQDVWAIFCRRWREWEPQAGADPADARPVLSFLFRTCHLVLLAHRRIAKARDFRPIDEAPDPAVDGHAAAMAHVQLGECLSAARHCCSDEEMAIVSAKLAGVPAREIARTLHITEAVVDHGFRNAVARIRERLSPPRRRRTR